MLAATTGHVKGPDHVPLTCAGLSVTLTVAVVLPPRVAVSVIVCGVVTIPAVAVNVVEVVLDATVTKAGTDITLGLLDDSATKPPPVRAA